MCVSPLFINGFRAPCGHCYECQSARRSEWAARNLVESFNSSNSYFLTLTFDDDHLSRLPFNKEVGLYSFDKSVYQNFLKRFRKDFTFRYFLVHEYGSHTYRPHYHALIFFQDGSYLDSYIVSKYWTSGSVVCDELTQARIHYVTKYLNKPFRRHFGTEDYWRYIYRDSPSDLARSLFGFHLFKNTCTRMSTRPGIGYQFLYDNDMVKYIRDYVSTNNTYPSFSFQGQTFRLPRYYINKLFTEDERKRISEFSQKLGADRELDEAKRNSLSIKQLRSNKVRRDGIILDNYSSKCLVSDFF